MGNILFNFSIKKYHNFKMIYAKLIEIDTMDTKYIKIVIKLRREKPL